MLGRRQTNASRGVFAGFHQTKTSSSFILSEDEENSRDENIKDSQTVPAAHTLRRKTLRESVAGRCNSIYNIGFQGGNIGQVDSDVILEEGDEEDGEGETEGEL